MRKQLFLLSALCLSLTACESMTTSSGTGSSQQGQNRGAAADNTGRNVRDRSGQTLTAGDQPENEMDRTITKRIREALMDDDSLSTNAKNVKIMTINGVVTLRGPVNNDREKNEIGRKAKAINGVRSVDNQIEITGDANAGDGSRRGESMNMDRDLNR